MRNDDLGARSRPKSEPPPPAANGVVVLSAEQLQELIANAVSLGLAHVAQRPALLDRRARAEALMCSASQVDKLRRAGMPWVRVGDSPRFDLEACLEWCKASITAANDG